MVINGERREALERGLAFFLWGGLGHAGQAFAAGDSLVFEGASIDEAIEASGVFGETGPAVPVQSGIVLTVPDLVENGAVVPVSVTSQLAETREIAIFAEFNPNPLIARFSIPAGTEAFISTRVKIAQSGRVYAVVNAGGRLYSTCAGTKVSVGGCGA